MFGLVVLFSPCALAQTSSLVFELERLTLEPGSTHSLTVGSGDGLRAGLLQVSLLGHYQHEPLVFRAGGTEVGDVVSARGTAVLSVVYGVFDWLELGAQLPVFVQGGDDLRAEGVSPVAPAAFGSPTLRARVTVLREDRGDPLDLGFSLGGEVPLGSVAALARDPRTGLSFSPRVGLGHRFGGLLRVGGELGAEVREQPTLLSFATQPAPALGTLLSAGLTATTVGSGVRGGLDVRGLMTTTTSPVASVELLGQVRWPLAHTGVELLAAAGPGFGRLAGTPSFRALVGVSWAPLGAAACLEGQAYRLSDCPWLDRDGDGVPNGRDRCPELEGVEAEAGCPALPSSPRLDFLSAHHLDADLDGTPDTEDRCPSQVGALENQGCPLAGPDAYAPRVDLAQFLQQQIHFQFDSDRLLLDEDALADVADLLEAVPEGTITIEGHTDGVGSREVNARLSLRRAETVRDALISRGLPADRLRVEGRGLEQPVASNADSQGRALNRRVRFFLTALPPEGSTDAAP